MAGGAGQALSIIPLIPLLNIVSPPFFLSLVLQLQNFDSPKEYPLLHTFLSSLIFLSLLIISGEIRGEGATTEGSTGRSQELECSDLHDTS